MHTLTRSSGRLLLLAMIGLCSGCVVDRVIDHTEFDGTNTSKTATSTSTTGGPGTVTPGVTLGGDLHDQLVVDGSVYRGKYVDGTEYEGISGERVVVDLQRSPNQVLALLHASWITQLGELGLTPDDVLSVAVVRSRLKCESANCFGLNDTIHWAELKRFFPERFPPTITPSDQFAPSAIMYAYYQRFSVALWVKDTTNPAATIKAHPEPAFLSQTLYLAHVWSPWWEGFKGVFGECTEDALATCVAKTPGETRYIEDQLGALWAVRGALGERGKRVTVSVNKQQAQAYLTSIQGLFPGRSEAVLQDTLDLWFKGSDTLESQADLVGLVQALHRGLTGEPERGWMRRALCAQRALEPKVCP